MTTTPWLTLHHGLTQTQNFTNFGFKNLVCFSAFEFSSLRIEFEAKNVPSTFYDVPLAPQDAVVNLDVPNENPIFDEVHFHHDPVNPVFQPISIPNILEESSEETTTEITEEEDTTDFSNDDFLDAMEIEDSAATEQPGLKPLTVKLKLQGGKIKELVAISVLPVEVKEDFKPRKETGKLENRDIYR